MVRVVAGVIFVLFSTGKLAQHEATVEQFVTYGFADPTVIVYLVGLVELVGGLMLIVGVGTRLAALGLAVDMIGAIATAGRAVGGPIHLGLAPALLVAMLIPALAGPGAMALDSRLVRPTGAAGHR